MIENIEEDAMALLKEMFKEQVSALIEEIDAQVSEGFTEKINTMYKSQGLKDAQGKIIQIATPLNLSSRIVWSEDSMQIELSAEEERWFRADQIHGRNLLESYGFKALIGG